LLLSIETQALQIWQKIVFVSLMNSQLLNVFYRVCCTN